MAIVQQGTPLQRHQQATSTLRPSIFWRIREEIPPWLTLMLGALSILLPLLVWALVAASGIIPTLFLPSPQEVLRTMGRMWLDGTLLTDIGASVLRVVAGFALAVLIAVPIGILMGTFTSIGALFSPLVGTLRYLPASAFIPLLILWLGIEEAPKIALIVIGAVFYTAIMVADAVKFVPRSYLDAAYTLGATRWRVLTQVVCPAVLPSIIDVCRVNMAAAWNLVIIAELIAASSGLGFRILRAQRYLRTDEIFVGLIVIGVIGLLIDAAFFLLQRWLCTWVRPTSE